MEGNIQLVTGDYKDDKLQEATAWLSIETHGMLWKWITSGTEGHQRIAQRYSVVIIDGFAKVPVGRGGTELLQPHAEEMARVAWQLEESDNGGGGGAAAIGASLGGH